MKSRIVALVFALALVGSSLGGAYQYEGCLPQGAPSDFQAMRILRVMPAVLETESGGYMIALQLHQAGASGQYFTLWIGGRLVAFVSIEEGPNAWWYDDTVISYDAIRDKFFLRSPVFSGCSWRRTNDGKVNDTRAS